MGEYIQNVLALYNGQLENILDLDTFRYQRFHMLPHEQRVAVLRCFEDRITERDCAGILLGTPERNL